MSYYVELVQTDPKDSPTPGFAHYAGEVCGFETATAALEAGITRLGKPAGEAFYPCCDWQSPDAPITAVVVYFEDEDGYRSEDWSVTASLKKPTQEV